VSFGERCSVSPLVRLTGRSAYWTLSEKVLMNITIQLNSSPTTSSRIHFRQPPYAARVYCSLALSLAPRCVPRLPSSRLSVESSVCAAAVPAMCGSEAPGLAL
jgi:hypothetical protein